MNTETLRQIFKLPFDYTTYSNEIVHRLFGCNNVATRPELLDTNTEGDQSFFIGQMDDTDHRLLGFFYTRMADGGDVRRKRVGLRKLISPYLKYDVDGAIAVFDDGQHWRLSYICDLKEGSTSAKRFSYILGDENGQYKTPLERLEKVAKLNGCLKLADLKESFSVDALSDEFFDEYHLHYDRIVVELARQGKTGSIHHDYVKKMMGRIVFLHFLQKKGWLNGNPTFLRDLFLSSPHQTDFLEQVLEPLFFGIFNTESEQRKELFANEHWDKGLLKQWEHLPYLNGGLFERDEVDKMNIRLPASLFNNLFTFLASYNFTVDENDPDDAEIGVDPEMLGKIFESLLEDNKAKGAFYTPKEIVRYMCKESLIAYLTQQLADCRDARSCVSTDPAICTFVETHEFPSELEPYRDVLDRALREVKICDPAIGSGAFPMGLLNELWRCREAIGTPSSRLQLKKEIIENNIYGVDIEQGAIDIARLRFWLSIVVDSDEPEALPNFDYKFMQGNSLIENFEGVDLSRMMDQEGMISRLGKGKNKAGINQLGLEFVSSDTKRNLQLMLHEYFSITDHVKKTQQRCSINESVKSYIRQLGISPSAEIRLSALDPSANQEFFLWHTWFKEIFDRGGFDIVIGNPPYGADIDNLTKVYETIYPATSHGFKDIYKYFFEQGVRLLHNDGVLSYITPSTFIRQPRYGDLRRMMLKYHLLFLIDLGENVFKAIVPVAITLLQKNEMGLLLMSDLTKETEICHALNDIKYTKIEQKSFDKTLNNIFVEPIAVNKPYKTLDEILVMKDCGFKYQRSNVGLSQKGKNDLADRIFYLGDKINSKDIPILIGKDINSYYHSFSPLKKLRHNYKDLLRENEGTYYNKEIMSSPVKLIWRQTAPYFIGTVLNDPIFFGNTIQAGVIREEYRSSISYEYLCGLLNSKYIRFLYSQIVKETGRVFPQVKLEKLKPLPIILPNSEQQKSIVDIVSRIISIKNNNPEADTLSIEREIDRFVYGLYGLTPEEIAIIEKGA